MSPSLLLEELDAEQVLALLLGLEFPFDEDLDEEDLGDFVEGGDRIAFLPVPDDVVALVEQVGELVLLEDLQALDQFLDLLVGGVGVGDAVDLLHVLRHLVVEDTPVARLAVVVGDEERGVGEAGIVLPLGIDRTVDGDVVGLALHDNQRGFLGGLVLRGAPDDEVSSRLG